MQQKSTLTWPWIGLELELDNSTYLDNMLIWTITFTSFLTTGHLLVLAGHFNTFRQLQCDRQIVDNNLPPDVEMPLGREFYWPHDDPTAKYFYTVINMSPTL